ncbi:hypothetical protein LAZ67_8002222 [Cordylochernes scorpioides]|uniref:Uncharacterized protein n=1 Tax=Cordylochernes scorpioides TaxID=51811 RepID=A0ABY6KQT2_9ARAC|nr:hypothetical protein LAZ67_8002222 [Cordylochernes scorpioides]
MTINKAQGQTLATRACVYARTTLRFHRRVKAKTSLQDDNVPIDDKTRKTLFTSQDKRCQATKDKVSGLRDSLAEAQKLKADTESNTQHTKAFIKDLPHTDSPNWDSNLRSLGYRKMDVLYHLSIDLLEPLVSMEREISTVKNLSESDVVLPDASVFQEMSVNPSGHRQIERERGPRPRLRITTYEEDNE